MAEKSAGGSDHFKGWLWKWTNYVKGYQKRWFVLSNGLLSYYKSQAEVSLACRGTIILAGASIVTEDSCHFTISNGSAHRYHLKASSEVERQRWITALELAKSLSKEMLDSEESSDEGSPPASARGHNGSSVDPSKSDTSTSYYSQQHLSESERQEIRATLTPLEVKLADLETCNNLIGKHGTTLLAALADLEAIEKQASNTQTAGATQNETGVSISKLKVINERAMLFRITSSAMISACTEFLQVAKAQGKKWQKMLTHEREQRLRLEDTVETLAKQHNSLERALNASAGPPPSGKVQKKQVSPQKPAPEDGAGPSGIDDKREWIPDEELSDDDEFMDAYEEAYTEERKKEDDSSSTSSSTYEPTPAAAVQASPKETKPSTSSSNGAGHRTTVPFKPNYRLNLWSVVKNCIGRDLSKIPVPVNFNEPLSMLQRLSEDLEYSELLDKAAKCSDPIEQMTHVVAFSVSSYSTTLFRTGKPFNPLLGETFEFDGGDEFGYRLIAEQVSHHPPAAAFYADSTRKELHGGWSFWQEITLASKFRGKYLSVTPIGTCHVKFHSTGHHYTWTKVSVTVHNIIVGKLWVDQAGESNIVNHVTGDHCKITFCPYSYFARDTPRKVSGTIIDKSGVEHYHLFGTWDATMKCKKVGGDPKSQPIKMLWQKYPLPPLSEKMYFFTKLALILNEWVDGTPPTDSRRRPDQRKMEEGAWDDANTIKLDLEERQRTRRKTREANEAKQREQGLAVTPYKPAWFKKSKCSVTNEEVFVYDHEYWEAREKKDWSRCMDIFDRSSETAVPPSTAWADFQPSTSDGRLTPSFDKQPTKVAPKSSAVPS